MSWEKEIPISLINIINKQSNTIQELEKRLMILERELHLLQNTVEQLKPTYFKSHLGEI